MMVIKKLLEHGANPCVRSSSVERAILGGKYDIVKLFLGHLDELFYGSGLYYCLEKIISRGDYDMLELLLPHIKNINREFKNKKTILDFARNVKYPNNDIIELLLENGAH